MNQLPRKSPGLFFFIFEITLLHAICFHAQASINSSSNKLKSDLSFGFIENKGQIVDQNYRPNPQVKFIYAGKDIRMHLRESGFSYELFSKRKNKFTQGKTPVEMRKIREEMLREKTITHRIDIELLNSNKDAEVVALDPYTDYINYYTGAPQGIVNVKHYRKVVYKNIYPNIDIEFETGTENHPAPKYNFIVRPGGKLSDILIKYKGSDKIELRDNKLFIQTSLEPIVEDVPLSYQNIAGQQKNVNVIYKKVNENTFTFTAVGSIDNRYELVIDPVPNVNWGTYYGGSDVEEGMGITFDPSGNVISCGESSSISNVATAGTYQTTNASPGVYAGDAFIVKFNGTTGLRMWCTFYGGAGWEGATAVTSDLSGNILFTGWFYDGTYATTGLAHQTTYGGGSWDAVCVKLNGSNGTRIWGTYYGGTMDDEGWSIVTDASENIFIGGNTQSIGGIATAGTHQTTNGGGWNDSFIAKFSSAGARLWGTYYGGTGNETDWYRSGLDVDGSGNVIYSSWTDSPNTGDAIASPLAYKTSPQGGADAFVVKIDGSNGTRMWGTYYGGTGDDYSYGAIVDASNNIIIAGETTSPNTANAIATGSAYDQIYGGAIDAFVAKFDGTGARLWGTYFGGANSDKAFNIDNICSNILVYGITSGFGAATPGTHQPTHGGGTDAFIFLLNSTGTTVSWYTYYGGAVDETAYWNVCSIASNSKYGGNEFAITGTTTSSTQIAYTGIGTSHDNVLSGGEDAFVAKFDGAVLQIASGGTTSVCNGKSVTLSASGATTYSWAPGGQTTSAITISPTTNSTYTVIGADAAGCTGSATLSVTVTSVPTPSVAATGTLCLGQNTTLTASGGVSYLWNNGATTTILSGVANGTYTVTATNASGCTATATGVVNQAPLLTNTVSSSTNISCNGGSNGAATATAGGGVSPYTYLWTGGQTTATATGFGIGNYTITVTDANACTRTATVAITQPAILTNTVSSSTNVSCNGGSNGAATATAGGGTSPYTYLWTGGQTTATATGFGIGNYTITVTDANACTRTATVAITQPTLLTNTVSASTNVSCNGGNNGAATATAGGGTSPYTYLWTGGQTTINATGLTQGNYTITVTDFRGCTRTATVAITQPAILTNTVSSSTNVSCNGGSNGAATATAGGGTSPYTYLWTGGQTTVNATGLAQGNYTITVTDANTCTRTATVAITQPTLLTNTVSASTNVSCNGGSNGAATATAGGGTSPYTYLWTGGQTTVNATGLSQGNYTVTVTDANTCTRTATVAITQPTLLTNTVSSSVNVSCNGGNNGAATATAGGGTSPYTYLWTGGQTTVNATGLAQGNYTVTVTDANTCTRTATIAITQPVAALSATLTPTQAGCTVANGTATANPSGGTGAYTYSWSAGAQTTSTATGLSVGTYTVLITDANACTRTNTISVTATAAPTVTTSSTQSTCGNNNGSANASPSGGTGAYTYLWSGGQTSTAISGLAVGIYTITITDANGCTDTEVANITNANGPSATTTVTATVLCFGGNNGSANANPSGGTSPYTYAWSNGQTTLTATGLTAGTHTVTVTDNNGCPVFATASVSQPAVLSSTASAQTNVSCFSGNNGIATSTVSGGTSPYTYLWTGGQTTTAATGFSAGNYTLTVTDANACTRTATVAITQPTLLTNTVSSSVNVSCNGGNNATASTTVSGGTSPYTYLWTNGGQTTTTATGLSSGNYTITVTDANACTRTATVAITQPAAALSATVTSTPAGCTVANGTATANPSGGTGAYTYSWSSGGQTTSTATGFSTGTYTTLITDNNGCTNTNTVNITATVPPTVTVSFTQAGCVVANGTATANPLGGTGAYTYNWSPGVQTTSTATGLSTGTYTLLLTDNNGCTGTNTVSITATAAPTVTTSIIQSTCGNSNGSADASPSGGTGVYTYLWSPGAQTSQTATGLGAGFYTVTITDANGCTNEDVANVTNANGPSATASVTGNVSCFGGNDGIATANPSGGTPGYTYLWSNGETAQITTGLSASSYSVIIADANGCTITTSVTITEPTVLSSSVTSQSVSCNGGNNATATVNASGGTGAYTYLWSSGGQVSQTAIGLSANTYTVSVWDANGCLITDSITVTEPAVLSSSVTSQSVSCNGGNNGTATVNPAGGNIPYTYNWMPGSQASQTANGLLANTYTVSVWDANGCLITDSITITEPTALSLPITSQSVSCNGASNGTATVNPAGGNMPYTYNWIPGNQVSQTVNWLSANTYTVSVWDANGCSTSASVTIAEPVALSSSATSQSVSCNGGSNGTATVNPVGGNAPYTYDWIPGGPGLQTAIGLSIGIYSVTITDANGCTIQSAVTISEPLPITLSVSGDDSICSGFNTLLNAASLGGTPAYTYDWMPGSQTGPSITVSPVLPTTYSVTATDANGCASLLQTFTLSILPAPNALFDTAASGTYSAVFSFTDLSIGGTSWLWDFGDGTTSTQQNPIHTFPAAAIYTVTQIAYNQFGCPDTFRIDVAFNEGITIPNVFTPDGDGINDVWYIPNSGMKDFHLEIFNRWGEKVFETVTDEIRWDGHSTSGKLLADGTYYFTLTAILKSVSDGTKDYSTTGYITLLTQKRR